MQKRNCKTARDDGRGFERFADFIVRSYEEESLKELVEETRELYGDENKLVDQMLESFQRAWRAIGKNDSLPSAKTNNGFFARQAHTRDLK